MYNFFAPAINAINIFPWRVLSAILFFFYSTNLFAEQVTLVWDPAAGNVGGYRLYYGRASGNYTSNIKIGNQTSYTLAELTVGTTYYFAITAYDGTTTIESGFSNEVSTTIPASTNLVMTDGFE